MAVNLSIKTSIFNIFFSYLFGISLFITSLPYFVWDNPLFRYIFQIIIVLLSVINLQKRNSNSRYILMGIFLQINREFCIYIVITIIISFYLSYRR